MREENEDRIGEIVEHPLNPDTPIFGIKLSAGDTIRPGDVYDSTSGKWEKAPIVGAVLQKGCKAIWVRRY